MRRPSSLRCAVDRRLLVGVGVVAAGLLVATQIRRSPPVRPVPVRRPVSTPAPAPVPVARDAGTDAADVFVWTMPTFSERDDDASTRPPPRASRGNNVFPPSTGDYGVDVANIVRPVLPALGRCLAASGATGSVDVTFTITPQGDVRGARAVRDAGASVDACLAEALRETRFPAGPEPFNATLPVMAQ